MTQIQNDDTENTGATSAQDKDTTATDTTATENQTASNAVKAELDRVAKKGAGKSELEKARFTRAQIDKKIDDLEKAEGVEPTLDDVDDNAPVTVGAFKKYQSEQAQKTALVLADERVKDEDERELVKYHLNNTIKPTGNAQEDLKNAIAIVSSVKNQQVAEHLTVVEKPRTNASGPGAPANRDVAFEPTAQELAFMKPPYNMTKEDVLKARAESSQANQSGK